MKENGFDKLDRRLSDRERGRERERRRFHSRAYHQYFEGWSEYYETDGGGKPRLRRVYTGEYYIHPLTGRRRALRKLALGGLWLLAAAAFVFGATRRDAANNVWYVAAAQAGAVVGLAWMASALFNTLAAPEKMTRGIWRGSAERLKKSSLLAAAFTGLAALLTLLHLALAGGTGPHLLSAAAFAASCGLALLSWRVEARTAYSRVQSDETVPPEAARIQ